MESELPPFVRFSLIGYPSPLCILRSAVLVDTSDDSHLKNIISRVAENCLWPPGTSVPFIQRDPSCGTIMRAVVAKCAGRPNDRCCEPDAALETPRRRDRLKRRCDDTIRTTLSYPSDGYEPRARKGSPFGNTGCYRRRNGERERERTTTIKEEDSYLALVPTVCVKGG